MNINQAIEQLHSCHAYTDKAVTTDQIKRILTTASQSSWG